MNYLVKTVFSRGREVVGDAKCATHESSSLVGSGIRGWQFWIRSDSLLAMRLAPSRQLHKLLQVRTSGVGIQTVGHVGRTVPGIAGHRQRHYHIAIA